MVNPRPLGRVPSFLGYAARTGHLVSNPADLLMRRERPRLGRPKDRFLTTSEIERLLSHTRGVANVATPILLFTGLRVSELLGLVWEDVDFERSVIRVHYRMTRRQSRRVPLKTDAGRREVVLMAEVAHRLRKTRLATPFSADADLVLANTRGRTVGYKRLRTSFAAATCASGLEGVTPHTCRHTFASILIDQGRDVEFVSQQLGHSGTKTTWDTYVHLFRAREQADAARRDLDAAFGRMLRAADTLTPGRFPGLRG